MRNGIKFRDLDIKTNRYAFFANKFGGCNFSKIGTRSGIIFHKIGKRSGILFGKICTRNGHVF